MMKEKISEIRAGFNNEITTIVSLKDIEELRIKYLSRNGDLAKLFDELKTVSPDEKPIVGKELNLLRQSIQQQFDAKKEELERQDKTSASYIDLSLPGRKSEIGSKHLLTQTVDEIKSIFKRFGFSVAEGPELESDHYNFEALNFAPDHPARDMQDTFFVNKDFLLRTHTSPVQIRLMEQQKPPIRAIMPGKVYRNEAISSRSYSRHFNEIFVSFIRSCLTFNCCSNLFLIF